MRNLFPLFAVADFAVRPSVNYGLLCPRIVREGLRLALRACSRGRITEGGRSVTRSADLEEEEEDGD